MLFDTAEEYTEEIASVQEDIKRVRKIGREHANNSGSTSRSTTETDLQSHLEYKSQLQRERDLLLGTGGVVSFGG